MQAPVPGMGKGRNRSVKPWDGVQNRLGSRSHAALSNVSAVSYLLCRHEVAIDRVHLVPRSSMA